MAPVIVWGGLGLVALGAIQKAISAGSNKQAKAEVGACRGGSDGCSSSRGRIQELTQHRGQRASKAVQCVSLRLWQLGCGCRAAQEAAAPGLGVTKNFGCSGCVGQRVTHGY